MATPTSSLPVSAMTAASSNLTGSELLYMAIANTPPPLKLTTLQLQVLYPSSSALVGTETLVTTSSGTTPQKTTVAQLVQQQTASTALTGAELLLQSDATTTTKKTTFSQVVTQATAAGTQAATDLFYSTQSSNLRKYSQSQIVEYVPIYTASGTNTYTISSTIAPTAYQAGMVFRVTFTNANSGASTLNVSSLGAKNIFAYGATLLGNEIRAGFTYTLFYDGTEFQLTNPSDSSGSFTITLTGYTPSITGTVNWRIIQGNTAVITLYNDISGTSTATTMTGTGIPTALQPTSTVMLASLAVRDNNTGAIGGQVSIPSASGTWTFGNALPTTQSAFPKAWTGSSLKGLFAQSFTYPLRP